MKLAIAPFIDHTLLKPDATENDIRKLISEAIQYQFKSVCINPSHLIFAKSELARSAVELCTVVGFPLGAHTKSCKVFETEQALKDGATEVDMVLNISALKQGAKKLVLDEIKAIKHVCGKIILKVIIETCLLSTEEKILSCKIISDSGADFIKTSTGFSHRGADLDDIFLFKQELTNNVQIKASGGIKNYEQAVNFIEAGASRIGTSSGIAIALEH